MTSRGKKINVDDTVFCRNALPFGRSGYRKVLRVSEGHSVYVRLTRKDSAYQNREPHQGFWQVGWSDLRQQKQNITPPKQEVGK